MAQFPWSAHVPLDYEIRSQFAQSWEKVALGRLLMIQCHKILLTKSEKLTNASQKNILTSVCIVCKRSFNGTPDNYVCIKQIS